jgi:hypothetical protein
MDKKQILAEIKRLAVENGGQAPGRQAFARTTGVKMSDWYPHIWLRWGDALAEAGHAPNRLQTKVSDEVLVEKYIGLVRELGRVPVEGEIRRKARQDQSFPAHTVFGRFGGKDKLVDAVALFVTGGLDLKMSWRSVPNFRRRRRRVWRQAGNANRKSRLNLSTS